ncbi:MAG: hypothetical protein M3R52_10030, partial [Acidobacteriota bacterium]|nr:hypothetical protein [Acidobacteriota bacterium]
MAAPKDKQSFFDWPQDTEASPDNEDVASVELNREAEGLLHAAQAALAESPTDPDLLLRAALAALLEEQSELSLRYQHRFSKRYAAMVAEDQLLRAVALAQQGRWPQAAQVVKQHGSAELLGSIWYLPGGWTLTTWFRRWLTRIEADQRRRDRELRAKTPTPRLKKEQRSAKSEPLANKQVEKPTKAEASDSLPAFAFAIPISITFP